MSKTCLCSISFDSLKQAQEAIHYFTSEDGKLEVTKSLRLTFLFEHFVSPEPITSERFLTTLGGICAFGANDRDQF